MEFRKRTLLLFMTALAAPTAALAAADRLTLKEAENLALSASARIAGANADAQAAREQADAQYGALFPKLSLDANYRYVGTIPELRLGPVIQRFGDNENYSVGPTLSYTLWDTRAARQLYRSAQVGASAREAEKTLTERQVRMQTRVAYTQAQLATQELELVRESLSLARRQNKDVESRFRAGSASRLDFLSSQREITQYELREAQSGAEQRVSMTELSAYVPSFSGKEDVALEDLEETARNSRSAPPAEPETHPQIVALERASESLSLAARAQGSAYWPIVQVQARMSYDYPNGPNLERIQQNSAFATLSWNLFEGGRTNALVAQKEAEAESMKARRNQALSDLERDRAKARARIGSLGLQLDAAQKAVTQSEDLAKLNYEAHRAGRLSLFEVHTSNLRLLEAKIQRSRILAQLLIQRYTLDFLGGVNPQGAPLANAKETP